MVFSGRSRWSTVIVNIIEDGITTRGKEEIEFIHFGKNKRKIFLEIKVNFLKKNEE